MIKILMISRELHGDGVVMVDGGANIGVHSITAGRVMQGWGTVMAFEAQERIFYALAGNVAINNLFNVQAKLSALAHKDYMINVPIPDYLEHGSFGSLEMQYKPTVENIGQIVDYNKTQQIPAIAIDSIGLSRLDFLKLDVEGMEEQALFGAFQTIRRCRPIMYIEHQKTGVAAIQKALNIMEYESNQIGPNTLAIHRDFCYLFNRL